MNGAQLRTRSTAAKACDFQRHRKPYYVRVEGWPVAGHVRHDEVLLELGQIRIANAHVRELTKTSVEAIDRFAGPH